MISMEEGEKKGERKKKRKGPSHVINYHRESIVENYFLLQNGCFYLFCTHGKKEKGKTEKEDEGRRTS